MSLLICLGLFLVLDSTNLASSMSGAHSQIEITVYDLVIRNARIIDGTGSPWFRNDIGIVGDNIVKVGLMSEGEIEQAKKIVNANGTQYLAPGFIDSHTHDDVAVFTTPAHTSKTLQGVTTVITGSCSFSSYPNGQSNPEVQTHLSSLLGEINGEQLFDNFTSLKNTLNGKGIGCNVGSLVGHGPIRISVMGYENRLATQDEIQRMCNLLEEQLEQGSIGLSLGLVYPPSAYAGIDELVALAKIVAKHDRIISAHIRSYEGNLLSSIQEFLNVLEQSGARGLLSHLQVAGVPYWGSLMSQALEIIEEARTIKGIDVIVDMYPYLAGSSSILQLLPPSAMSGGFDELADKILNDPIYYEALKALTETGTEPGWESKINLIGWENVVVNSVVSEELADLGIQGLNMTAGANKLGYSSEFDYCIFLVLQDLGRTNVIMFQQSEDDNNQVFKSKLHIIGSDSIPRTGGKPHPRMYGTFPRVLGQLAVTKQLFSIEEGIRKGTSATAQRFGLLNRGLIKPGMIADLILFNPDVIDRATYEDPTLSPIGIVGVWVNGIMVAENGVPTMELPGTVICASVS